MRTIDFYLTKETIVNNDVKYIRRYLLEELKANVNWVESEEISEMLYVYRKGLTEYPKCEVCGGSLKHSFVNGKRGYRRWCSRSCYKKSPDWRLTIKETSNQKYGTDHPLSSESVQQKRKETNLKKYGMSNPMMWSGELFKSKMIEHYGEQNTRAVPEINQKILDSINERNSKIYIEKLEMHLTDLEITPIDQIDVSQRFTPYKFKHSCGKEFTCSIDNISKIKCQSCHLPKNLSKLQFEIETFIRSLTSAQIIRNDRTLIYPYEIDILIPELKIGIEVHGDYWHTDLYVANDTHYLKTKMVEEKDYQLIQIFESEWHAKQAIIKSIISSKLGKPQKVLMGRKLSINLVSEDQEIKFFNENHLQGYARSCLCYGLYDEARLIACMSFDRPRFNKKYDWELIRFATIIDHMVIGGASKILSHFIKLHPNTTILTYADRRFSTGKLYEILGFELEGETMPNYWYVNFKKNLRYSRYQCQKKKLKRLLGENNFFQELSETENMILNGFRKIHDAGNLIFKKSI